MILSINLISIKLISLFLFLDESTIIKEYNVCDTYLQNITDTSGFIVSPNYPSFTAVNRECIQKIVVPDDRIIVIWFPSVNIKESESNNE